MGLLCLNLAIAAVRASAGGVQGPGASANEHLRAFLFLFFFFCVNHAQSTLETSTKALSETNPDWLRLLTAGEDVSVSLWAAQEVETERWRYWNSHSLDIYLFISPTLFYLHPSCSSLVAVIARHGSFNYSVLLFLNLGLLCSFPNVIPHETGAKFMPHTGWCQTIG